MMKEKSIVNAFESGKIYMLNDSCDGDSVEWKEHPKFKGVSLKNLIGGDQTQGLLSCHLVRVLPGCEIGDHIHEGRMELHEVIAGKGSCVLDKKVISYAPGSVTVIPADIQHKVVADEEGLYILAKFLPAL